MFKSELDYIKEHNKKKKENLKYDFMPDLLEIIERPAHIGGKVIIWTGFAFLIVVVLWATLSKVDVVVMANGTVFPEGNICNVQTVESGIITQVNVSNGQYVKKGDILAIQQINEAEVDMDSINTEISRLESENALYYKFLAGDSLEEINVSDYDEKIRTDIEYILRQEKYYVHSWEDITDEERMADAKEQHEISIMGKIVDNNNSLRQMYASKEKSEISLTGGNIKAEADGYVTGLGDDIEGKLISSGNVIMSIVPTDMPMEVQCYVSNSDISELHLGQEVVIKLSAYPYSDYGTINGEITYISANTIQSDNIQNMYMIKVSVGKHSESIKLMSGMTAVVEVKIHKRSVLDYFLEPVKGNLKNSIKEK